jgi:hypothetical protein|tara:strand:- start:205 stop:1245 length:1041 start_codon:yes stop_codon:yes gene_type:complete
MAEFNRPIPKRLNERLRENLKAPKHEVESLSEKTKKAGIGTIENNEFPLKGLSPNNRQPQKTPINRGAITRRDDDNIKDISIGLQDHDEAIAYYFNNVIKPSVVLNGDRANVPLIYGAPERWKSVQRDGFYRDKEGKIQVPLIMFKRDSVEKRRDLGNKMDANNPHLYQTFQIKYTKRNQYDNFSVLQNRLPQRQFHNVIIPDYVNMKYSFTIWTDYVAQMNKIVEAINYASDAYWGDPERFKFMARIDTFTNRVELSQGDNRVVKTDFGLTLQGYIVPDAMNAHLSSQPKKHFSKSTVSFSTHVINTFDPVKTREQIREEAGDQNIKITGTGIGYQKIQTTNQIS